jgi:hypothetical protein
MEAELSVMVLPWDIFAKATVFLDYIFVNAYK